MMWFLQTFLYIEAISKFLICNYLTTVQYVCKYIFGYTLFYEGVEWAWTPKFRGMTADRLAQLIEHRTTVREVVGSNPGRTNTQGL